MSKKRQQLLQAHPTTTNQNSLSTSEYYAGKADNKDIISDKN
ncbi:Uncharacterised protein [Legionella lansingensis]|nr:hypothetical protein [Legionella lansingensis]SNV54145.1 Uncharacterised protein [Legionella lansingensis]